jgi:uncharacterized protein (TIGR02246 family)
MPANRPEECDLKLAEAINVGDAAAAAEFYEDDARFVAGPGNIVEGKAAIGELMKGMVADKPRLTLEVPLVVQSGDLALLCSKWTSTTKGADGKDKTDSGNGREVVRRQSDGTWKFVLDHPTGGDS